MHIQVSDIRTCGDRCRVGIARIYPDTVPKVGVFLIDLDNCFGADRINWIARSISLIGALVIRIPVYSVVRSGWIVAARPCFFVARPKNGVTVESCLDGRYLPCPEYVLAVWEVFIFHICSGLPV